MSPKSLLLKKVKFLINTYVLIIGSLLKFTVLLSLQSSKTLFSIVSPMTILRQVGHAGQLASQVSTHRATIHEETALKTVSTIYSTLEASEVACL